MLPTEVPSDIGLEDEGHEALGGRWSILVDLQSEMQGAAGAYLIVGIVLPAVLVGIAAFGWTENPFGTLVAAGIIAVSCLSISAYTFYWYLWARRREARTFSLMQVAQKRFLEQNGR